MSDLLLSVFVCNLPNHFHVVFNLRLMVCCHLPMMFKLHDMVISSLLMVSYLNLKMFDGLLLFPELLSQFCQDSLVSQSFCPMASSSVNVLQVSMVNVLFEVVAESFDVGIVPLGDALHLHFLVFDLLL